MPQFSMPIIISVAFIIGLFVFFTFKFMLKTLKNKIESLDSQQKMLELLMAEMKSTIDKQKISLQQTSLVNEKKSLETEQILKQLEYRIKSQQDNHNVVEDRLQHLIEQQPEDKLYSRAFKLASLGADIEEIIAECDLPRAEAEMLLSVYKQKIR